MSQILENIKNKNDLMKKKIREYYNSFQKSKQDYLSKEKTYSKLFFEYNKERNKTKKIYTNRLIHLNYSKDDNLKNILSLENLIKIQKTKLNNILITSKGKQVLINEGNYSKKKLSRQELIDLTFRANRKVEKLFHDLLSFDLGEVIKYNKKYTLKLFYDVFIEFKTLLRLCIISNKDLNIHKKGIDLSSFSYGNPIINQQGEEMSKKIFKTFNNKIEREFIPWENYIDGMLRIKEPNKDKKMDLLFEILDESHKNILRYNDVYNLCKVSLKKILPLYNFDRFKIKEMNRSEKINIIEMLSEFFCKLIYNLVKIDINKNIPIPLLREKIINGGDISHYLEMFLGAENFI